MRRAFRLLRTVALWVAASIVVPAEIMAQTVTPGSSLPSNPAAASDVLFGIHGGTAGIGGVTSKFTVSGLGPVLAGIPTTALTTAGYSLYQCVAYGGLFLGPQNCVQSLTLGTSGNLMLSGTSSSPIIDTVAAPSFAGNLAVGGGTLSLTNATSNLVSFNTNGVGAPTFTTRSAGEKVVLFPNLSGSTMDYALGVQAAAIYLSLGAYSISSHFYVYGGTTQAYSLDGEGDAVFGGTVQAANAASGTASYVAPVYTTAGAAVASTYHGVSYTCTFAASTTCAVSGLTGAAVFASATYACPGVDIGTGTTFVAFTVGNKTTTGFTIYAGASNSDTVYGVCYGA